MKDLRSRLVELYSLPSVEKLYESEEYLRLFEKYETDTRTRRSFFKERDCVERLRNQIDQHMGGGKPARKQIEMALRLLWKLRRKPDRQPCCTSIALAVYSEQWSPEQRAYFERWAKFVVEARPYFLSFTTRNRALPAPNQVNRNHKHFILDALGLDVYEAADLSGQNLVAEAVHYHLQNKRPGGFYFPEHQGDNRAIKEKLLEALRSSCALVQLVQEEIFRDYGERPNWCHIEYAEMYGNDPQRILFVQIDPVIDYEEVELDFDEWYKEFENTDAVALDWTRRSGEITSIDKNFKRICHGLVAQIDRARDLVYERIP